VADLTAVLRALVADLEGVSRAIATHGHHLPHLDGLWEALGVDVGAWDDHIPRDAASVLRGMADEARADLARAREEARAEERAAVVAWLRTPAALYRTILAAGVVSLVPVAEAVERGAHLPKPEEAP
jgi:hypothetical protein